MKTTHPQQKTASPARATGPPAPLLTLPVAVPARLCDAPEAGEPPAWLVSLGFVPGTSVRIIRFAPLGGPVEIEIRGTRVCVRRADLAGFSVVRENAP